jgi:predicted transcriptional regulator
MKTSILQSMLARNKELITDLHVQCFEIKSIVKDYNSEIASLSGDVHAERYVWNLLYGKKQELQQLGRNQKSLKQLAEIQKAIKEEIRKNDAMEAYVVWLAKRGD